MGDGSSGNKNTQTTVTVKEREGKDFPGGAVVKTLSSQCRGPGFNPWSGS